MREKKIKIDRNVTVSVNGTRKRVHVKGEVIIKVPENLEEAKQMLGEKGILQCIEERLTIRTQDGWARKEALKAVAPERALMKEQTEKIKKLAQTLQEKGLSLEDVEKLISNL